MAQGTVQVTYTGTSRWRRRTGEYASLTAALEAAADGDVLTVAPGTYRENLVVQRAVTLRGPEGSPGSVRIAPLDGVPLTVRASAVVQDLHVEGQDAAAPALLVEEGTPELTDIRIVTRSAAGIEVRGGARPTVRRCTVDNPAGIGIAVLDGAGGVFEECEIVAAGQSGVAVRGGAHPAWSAAASTTPRAPAWPRPARTPRWRPWVARSTRSAAAGSRSPAGPPRTSPTAMCTAPPPTASHSTPTRY